MPLPRAVARFNKRYTDWIFRRLLQRTRGFALVEHRGRRTGRDYSTAIYAFTVAPRRVIVVLTYGARADWVQNVLASGGALRIGQQLTPIAAAEVVGRRAARHSLPTVVRALTRAANITDFMQLEIQDDDRS